MLLVFVVAAHAADTDNSLLVDVPGSSKRCIGEQFADESLGRWQFQVIDDSKKPEKESKVRVTLKDPTKKLLFSKALTYEKTDFSFTTKTPGLHKACLQNHHSKTQRVSLAVSSEGFAVKEYGNTEHLGPISKQIDKSMTMLREIGVEMDSSLAREEDEQRSAADEDSRIATMGWISMGVLLGLSCWQIIYLRSFFRSKKLL
ncbi:hypothetical protein CTAYLR_002049 [Chrysophaeum taylorii]|uniref:GOLD domain-containing protein n=1 Tax=Chrysophaeum taylorii TaxID=2483200 RepID=A0AAD7UP21_9STRA|nr:hypothetical protein CTAYLR_002049 [Chrysophaeum taylorii]